MKCNVRNCENKAIYKKTALNPFSIIKPQLEHYVCEKHKYHKPLKEYISKWDIKPINRKCIKEGHMIICKMEGGK